MEYIATIILIVVIIIIINKVLNSKKKKNIQTNSKNNKYNIQKEYYTNINFYKKKLMTQYESHIYNIIIEIINENQYIQAQMTLNTIINTNSFARGELQYIIDYVIFNKYTKEPIVAIEVNDKTHEEEKRIIRDNKVKEILNKAKLPLVILETKDNLDKDFVKEKLKDFI